MATALQCPSCGHKHRIDGPQSEPSFPCSSCGQTLKVPAQLRATTPESTIGSTAGSATATMAAAGVMRPVVGSNAGKKSKFHKQVIGSSDAPVGDDYGDDDDHFDDIDEDGAVAAAGAQELVGAAHPEPRLGAKVRLTRAQRRAVLDPPLPRWGRILIWLIALPLAAIVVLIPMRITRFFSGAYLLGLLSETGLTRFSRLAVAIVAVSIVAAVFVGIFTALAKRKRIGKLQEAAGASVDLALHEEIHA